MTNLWEAAGEGLGGGIYIGWVSPGGSHSSLSCEKALLLQSCKAFVEHHGTVWYGKDQGCVCLPGDSTVIEDGRTSDVSSFPLLCRSRNNIAENRQWCSFFFFPAWSVEERRRSEITWQSLAALWDGSSMSFACPFFRLLFFQLLYFILLVSLSLTHKEQGLSIDC